MIQIKAAHKKRKQNFLIGSVLNFIYFQKRSKFCLFAPNGLTYSNYSPHLY